MWYEPPAHDQPYPEFACTKGHWDGVSDTDCLNEPIECKDYKRFENINDMKESDKAREFLKDNLTKEGYKVLQENGWLKLVSNQMNLYAKHYHAQKLEAMK